MTTPRMRELVCSVYPGEKWRKKVNSMKDPQVFAIFCKFKNEGKIRL